MAEYIERELAIAETRKPRLTDAELRRRLANIPAADVVPAVRCSKCKHNGHCFTQSFVRDESVKAFDPDTWYCADGEMDGDGE